MRGRRRYNDSVPSLGVVDVGGRDPLRRLARLREDARLRLQRRGQHPHERQDEQQRGREQRQMRRPMHAEPTPAPRVAARGAGTAVSTGLVAIVVHPPFGGDEDDQRRREDDEEQDPGHGRGVAHAQVAERALVEVERVEHGRVVGRAAAGGHHVDLREVLERADEAHHEVEQDRRGDHGQRDVPEFAEPARAVDFGHLVQRFRHVGQTRQEDDHGAADAPQAHQDEGRFGPVFVGDPAGPSRGNTRGPVDLRLLQHAVDQAASRVEHPQPQHRRRHQRHDGRQEEHGAVGRDTPDLLVQEQSRGRWRAPVPAAR